MSVDPAGEFIISQAVTGPDEQRAIRAWWDVVERYYRGDSYRHPLPPAGFANELFKMFGPRLHPMREALRAAVVAHLAQGDADHPAVESGPLTDAEKQARYAQSRREWAEANGLPTGHAGRDVGVGGTRR